MAIDVQISHSQAETQPLQPNSPVGFGMHKLQEVIAKGSLDFYDWTSIISEVENLFPDDASKICLVYDAFLAEFPLCYGYWRKYAEHKKRLCTIDEIVEVFERAVQSATYSVGVWFDYCSFSISTFEDPHDIRRLFRRGLSFVGKDYLCHTLWDKFLEFEFSQQQWSYVAHLYIQALKFPSKKLHSYYDSFKKLVAAWEVELGCQSDSTAEIQSEFVPEGEVAAYYSESKLSSVINDLLDRSDCLTRSKALQKYNFIGEETYKEASQFAEKIHCFETNIRRPYFHVKPLDARQLENWHEYLNFAEKQGDFDWIVKLYERCLIPCADYPEFWMRYVDFMEVKGGREIANLALARATQIFHKGLPVIHLFNARYKEYIGDVCAARAALLQWDTESDSSFVENITMKANMEKRLGNTVAACDVYERALQTAIEKEKAHILPTLYVDFSRLKYKITNNADVAFDVLVDGIKLVPGSKLLLEELIKFAMMHGGPRHVNVLETVITNALYPGPGATQVLNEEDVDSILCLYFQFIDTCGTIDDVRKAWNWRLKSFARSMQPFFERSSCIVNPLNTKEVKKTIVALLSLPSGSNHELQFVSANNNPSPPDSHDIQTDQALGLSEQDGIAMVVDQKSLDTREIQSDIAAVDLQSGEADDKLEKMLPIPPEAVEQQGEDSPQPSMPSLESVRTNANETEPVLPNSNETEPVQASEEFCKENDGQREHDQESNQDLMPFSFEELSLDPGGNASPGLLCTASRGPEVPLETDPSCESILKTETQHENSNPNGNLFRSTQNPNGSQCVSSPMNYQPGFSQTQSDTVNPAASAGLQNFATESHLHPHIPSNGGRSWPQKHKTNRNRRDFWGHPHRRMHQQQQVSSQQYSWAEAGGQMPINPGYPSQSLPLQNHIQQGSQQNQFLTSTNVATPQVWPVQNLQLQNVATGQPQLPAQAVANPQALVSQYPAVSTEIIGQQGNLPNNHAYNQMWQYYYYQQQQFLLQQQQQPVQMQQLLQQPLDQQILLQQYQQQQLQLQQQYFQHQQIQAPHMHQYPQQSYQQQQQSDNQQLQHHHLLQLQQQLLHQQHLQQQPPLPLQIEVRQDQRQPDQQSSEIHCEDQGAALQQSTGVPETSTSAASPCSQQQSPQSH